MVFSLDFWFLYLAAIAASVFCAAPDFTFPTHPTVRHPARPLSDALLQAAEMYDIIDEGGNLLSALEERFPIEKGLVVQLDTELSFTGDPFLSGGLARDITL